MLHRLGLQIIPWQDTGCMGGCRVLPPSPYVWIVTEHILPFERGGMGTSANESCDISRACILVWFLSETEKTAEGYQYLPIHVPWGLF